MAGTRMLEEADMVCRADANSFFSLSAADMLFEAVPASALACAGVYEEPSFLAEVARVELGGVTSTSQKRNMVDGNGPGLDPRANFLIECKSLATHWLCPLKMFVDFVRFNNGSTTHLHETRTR